MLGAALCLLASRMGAQPASCPTDTGNAAQMEKKGRELFDQALRREPADPRAALEILTCVQRFADKPAVSLRVGIIAERLGNKRLAAEAFARYLALAGDSAPDKREMTLHIEQLRREAKLPVPKPDAEPAPEPEPTKPEPRADKRSATLGWVVTGAGGVLMLLGGALIYSAKQRSDEVHGIEPGTTRWNSADAKDKLDSARREQALGGVGLAAGAVTTAIGVWLVLDAKQSAVGSGSVGRHGAQGSLVLRF